MSRLAEGVSDSARIAEYRRMYIRCLRAQRADRIVAKVLLVAFAIVVLKTALDVSVNGGPFVRESRISVLASGR
jgi:hypothetical protein